MNSLDYLNINLTILNEKSPVRNCKNNKKIQLILQKTKDSLFNLHSIIVEDDNWGKIDKAALMIVYIFQYVHKCL